MIESSEKNFCRQFGEVYQYQWFYGDGSVDLVEHVSTFTQVGAKLAEQFDLKELYKIDEGDFRLFRPLNPVENVDTLVLLERYDDLRVWAGAEYIAQRSPIWMGAILDDQDSEHTWLGEGYLMADDAIEPPKPFESDRISIDWVTYDPTKKAALVEFPKLVQELTEAVAAAGFDQTTVRYFGMTTTAGPGLNLAHLWLEHASPSVLGEVLAWRQSAPELADWRRRINAIGGSIRSHHLLSQVA